MIEASNVHKTFGSFQAVRGISLDIAAGEVVALLGPNGAGKTTTVRMLGAILKPTRGYARIAGYDVVEQAREVRHVVGLLTEFPGLYNRMLPMDYLQFFGALQGMDRASCAQRSTRLLQQFGLWHAREMRLDSFSKGMKQKVALTAAHLLGEGVVADMGMGSGSGSEALAGLYPALAVIGVDVSAEMAMAASLDYRRPNLAFVCADIAKPLFASGSLETLTNCIAELVMPRNDSRYRRRMRKIAGQPFSRPSS